MSTGMIVSRGVTQDGVVQLESTFTCPANGEPVHSRMVLKSISDDERTVEMWTTMSGLPEFQSMSLHYKRAGVAAKADYR